MKIYFADTNIFLRFFLGDNLEQSNRAKKYFERAKSNKIQIVILPEILIEISYVLKKVYDLSRLETSQMLLDLVSSHYFTIKERELLIRSCEIYSQTNFDLVDVLLFEHARRAGGEVLSFDKDFDKLRGFKVNP